MTVSSFNPNEGIVNFSSAAVEHFKAAVSKGEKVLRLSTKTSGCTGYAYVLELVDQQQATDKLIEVDNEFSVAIADDTINLVRGTTIDIVQEGINRVVKYINPNVESECGCGESFSVKE